MSASHQYAKIRLKRKRPVPSIHKEDKIIGTHVFGNLYQPDMKLSNNVEYLKELVTKAIKISNMTLVEVKGWSFGGKKGGVTVIALITESHVALHTWNEYKYATLDIYTCGKKAKTKDAFDYIVKNLNPKRHQMFFADRSM